MLSGPQQPAGAAQDQRYNEAESAGVAALYRHTHDTTVGPKIALAGPQFGDSVLQHLSSPRYEAIARRLNSILISGAQFTDDGLHTLAQRMRELPMTRLADLTLLNLQVSADGILDVIESAPSLGRLEIGEIRLDPGFLEGLPDLPNLRSLHLLDTGATDAGVESLSRFRKLALLELHEPAVSGEAIELLQETFKPTLRQRLMRQSALTVRHAEEAKLSFI